MNMLKVTDLIAGYPGFHLDRISFNVEENSIVGIIGPNGSGKTTLLRTITGQIPIQKGSISYRQRDMDKQGKKELARSIAVVSQFQPLPPLKVREYVLLGRIPHFRRWQFLDSPENRLVAHQIMDLVGILDFQERFLTELSGGEQQLCHMARALVQRPRLLILDEPTQSLDISHQAMIMGLLTRMNRQQKITILMVVHDLNLASQYCQFLLLLVGGKIHTQGPPRQVLTREYIEKAYRIPVVISSHPLSQRPVVFTGTLPDSLP